MTSWELPGHQAIQPHDFQRLEMEVVQEQRAAKAFSMIAYSVPQHYLYPLDHPKM